MEGMNLITVEELARLVGCSVQTIGSYYKFKRENPNNELAKMLPDYVRIGGKHTRYWKVEDAEKIKEFRSKLPQGRNGALGSVTQRYVKNGKHNVKKEEPVANRAGKPITVTLDEFLMAEDLAVGAMARMMHNMNRSSKDEETMTMMLDLILQVTSKMQDILFGEECIEACEENAPDDVDNGLEGEAGKLPRISPIIVMDDEDLE